MLTPDQLRALVRKYPDRVAYQRIPGGYPCLRCIETGALRQFSDIREAVGWIAAGRAFATDCRLASHWHRRMMGKVA